MKFKVVARTGLMEGWKPDFAPLDVEFVEVPLKTDEDIINAAKDADAVMVGGMEPYTRWAIEAMAKCKIIARMGIGYDNIDVAAATEQGILVANVPDASTTEVSDHTLAFILALNKRMFPIIQAVKQGAWAPGKTDIPKIRVGLTRLSAQTVGLVGLGKIGSAVCKKAKAFGMKVLIYDPFIPAPVIAELGGEKATLDKVLAESDYVSLHAPFTKDTRHLIGAEQIKKMKRTAYIINTSRGALIDEQALIAALTQGIIAGAALDVLDPEPPKPDNPLIGMSNVIVTGHNAWFSEQCAVEQKVRSVEAVVGALSGKYPKNWLNPQIKEKPNCRVKQK